jgi:hypothetical protein
MARTLPDEPGVSDEWSAAGTRLAPNRRRVGAGVEERVRESEPVADARRRWLLAAYALTAAIASAVCGLARRCNNFLIYRAAFANLLAGRDLYAPHPEQHADLFKYSPTFAILFAPFALPPFALALLCWNLLNALALYYAVARLLPGREGTVALALTFVGLLATTDGTQCNGLVAALIVLAFVAFERDRPGRGALAVAAGVFVKLFPLAALSLSVPRRRTGRAALAFVVAVLALAALPLIVMPARALAAQYRAWYAVEARDAQDAGASVMGLLREWAGFAGANWPVQLAGGALLLLPLVLRRDRWDDATFRRGLLSSLLVYVVIFNHQAEQPTFVIALTGVAVWFATSARTALRRAVTAAAFLATAPAFAASVAPGRFGWSAFDPTLFAVLPCAVAWLTMQAELLGPRRAAGWPG